MGSAISKALLWDFDGTLARRQGGTSFGGCMIETLDEHEPQRAIDVSLLRPFLRSRFPWHEPETPHPELAAAELWWERVEPLLVRGFEGTGFASARAATLGRLARERYVDPRYWELFPDTIPTLVALSRRGWRHVILSNHVPELPAILAHLGLDTLVDATVNSAVTGYEKPHPQAFALARRAAGDPVELWMIGDNELADVAGAKAAGIPAILVRTEPRSAVDHHAATLRDVLPILEEGPYVGVP